VEVQKQMSWRRACPLCHDKVVVECDAEQAAEVKTWLDKAMIEAMEAVLSCTDQVDVPVEVEARIARSWGEGS
jgi:DNA polymerase I-like protein with 3'-5' exonuclease and polymerase domains